MDVPLGPHSAAVRAWLAHLRTTRWLAPDAALETESSEALAWLRDRADEHHAALAPFLAPGVVEGAARVRVVRSMQAACNEWDGIWRAATMAAVTPAYAKALERALEAADGALDGDLALTLEGLANAACAHVRAASPAWRPEAAGSPRAPAPGAVVARLNVRWLAAFGEDTPSPWAPLAAIWARGGWPLAMPDGSLLVYVPVLRDGAVVPDPAAPDARALPRRRPRPASEWTSMPALEVLGLGPAPGELEAAPLELPDWPTVGPQPRAEPDEERYRVLAGAAPPVTPRPVLGEAWPTPEEPKKLPWYKRLFRGSA